MSHKDTINLIKIRKDNEFNGIPTSFGTLKKVLPSWDHRSTTIISGATGTGKTSFIWRHAVTDVITFLASNTKVSGHVYYLSLELTKHELYIKLFAGMLEKKFNKSYDRDILLGTGKVRLSDIELQYLEIDCAKVLNFIDKHVTIIDTATSPNRILMELAEKIPSSDVPDPNMYNLIVVDTTNALTSDPGENKMETLKKWNQDIALKVFRNEKNCTVINIQQQDKSSTTRQFTMKGESVDDKYIPTLETLGGDKEASNSANLVLSIFNPITYGIREWGFGGTSKYSVGKFLGGLRFIYVNKNNFGDNNLVVPYFFDGAHNTWTEIDEDPSAFRVDPTLYNKYTGNLPKNLLEFT